jgi:hypothetical protein
MDPAALAVASLVWLGSTEIAAGRGERGPWQMNESRYDYVDDPTVAIDERGAVVVAWVDQARKDVYFWKDGKPGKEQSSVNVSRSPETFSWLPRVATDAKGTFFVLWQEIIFSGGSHGGDIVFARSEDGGRTFSQPLNLSTSVAGDGKGRITRDIWHNGSLDLVVGAEGTVYTAWTEYEGRLWVRRSADGGRSFSEKLSVRTDKPARAPSLAVDGKTVYLAWTVGDDPSADIRVAKSTDGAASFAAPVIVAKTKAYSDAPRIAIDGRGVLHLAYNEGRRVHYTRSDGGARFASPRDLPGSDGGFPALGLDGKGNIYVLWERFPEPYLPRGLELAVSADRGSTFTRIDVPESVGAGRNGSLQGLLMRKLAVSAGGAVAIVNSSFKENAASRVWLIRGKVQP